MLLPRASGHLPEALLRGSHFPRAIFCDFWRSPLSPANADYAKTQVRAFDSAFWSIGVAYRTLCCRPPPFPNRACAPHHPPSSQIAAWSSTITILVTGSTGTIGSQVVQGLAGQSARVRALVRGDASKIKVPAGVEPVQGDLTDVASMRTALKGVDTLFLLNAVAADETTQALGTLGLAREAGIQRIVYFSTFNSALFDDVPHFASKYLVERVIDAQAVPATVLRPGAFMQNDLMLRDALEAGIYPQPIGGVGVAMVDIRDIADAVVAELLRRERAPHPLPRTTIELVGPDTSMNETYAAHCRGSRMGNH
jgi:uncharacterized protein YbjT (DUF2867 family)